LSSTVLVFGFLKRDVDYASVVADQALALNPNNAIAWNVRGWISILLGEHQSALDAFTHAMRLNPVDPVLLPNLLHGNASACGFLHRHAEALVSIRKALVYQPDNINYLGCFVYFSQELGLMDESRATAERFRSLFPNLRASYLRRIWTDLLRRPEDRKTMNECISSLGLPE
jgi:tetratricopeptide (TPR) repeat protein